MKRMLWSVLAVAGMFFFASCSKDDAKETGSVDADYVEASFTVNSPEEVIGTRANDVEIGDGTKADKVVCAVFDCYGEEMDDLRQILPIRNKQATYSIRLAKGQDYRVVFFAYHAADNSDQPEFYNIKDLKNIEILDTKSNIEERDAFTAYYDVEHGQTMQPINEDITLYRPFAQLNLGTEEADWEAAVMAGVEVAETEIIVSNVYTTFSAFDDEVVGEPQKVTYKLNAKPSDALYATIDGKEQDYVYLALNYLLVGDKRNEKNLTDVEFIWKNAAGNKTNNPTTVFHNIPVQRNYRTNIIGWLLTNAAEFNITIDERFEKPDYNIIAVDGTQDAEDIAEDQTHPYVDNGNREIAVIENMHITADGTAIVVDDIDAPSGTLLVANSTINAKLFMELNQYYTIIVRKCHLNVKELLKITTGKTAYQIIFSDCYLNGEPMVKEKKNEYFTDNFLSLNTVNIFFNGDDSYVGSDDDNQGGNDDGDDDGDDDGNDDGGNQGGNDDGDDDDGNDDGNQGGETAQNVKMSESMNSLGEVYNNQFFYIHDKEFKGTVTIDAKAFGDLYYFENVTFTDYIYLEKSQTLIFDNCTFSKKGLVINKSGDSTVQVQAKNCKLANGDAIGSKDIKTW